MTFLEQVGEIAREAGRFVRGMADNRALRVEEKGSSYDFVTEADTGSQQLIVQRVAGVVIGFPSSVLYISS